METVDDLRRQTLAGGRMLWRELRDVYGHVSCRLPDGSGFLIKMVRVPPEPIDPDSVMVFDYDGQRLEGEQEIVEVSIHSEILKRRPDMNAVVHVHPHTATAISTTGRTVYALTHQSAAFGEGLPLFHGRWISTPQLGKDLAECVGEGPGAMMKGHGIVVVGTSVAQAVERAIYLEEAAQQLVMASILGTPEVFPAEIRNSPERKKMERGGGGGNLFRQLLWEMNQEKLKGQ